MPFRLRILAGAAPLAVMLALTAGGGDAQAQSRERVRDAEELCVRYAEDLLRDRGGGRSVELDEIVDSEELDDDTIKIQGYVRVDDRDRRGRGVWLDCDVKFEGDDRVTYFDEENFFRSMRRDRDGGRDRDRDRDRRRGGNVQESAREACREMVEDQGFQVADISDRDRTENGARLEMRLRRNDRRWDAVCQYNRNQDEARFVRLQPEGGRRRNR